MVSILALAARRIIQPAHTEIIGERKSLLIRRSEFGGLASRLFQLIFNKYVQMLGCQQSQLIAAIEILYNRLQTGQSWTGPPLDHDAYGQPLTHQILEGLEVLGSDHWEGDAPMSPCLKVPRSPSQENQARTRFLR